MPRRMLPCLAVSVVVLVSNSPPLQAQIEPPPGFESFKDLRPKKLTPPPATQPSRPAGDFTVGVFELVRVLDESIPTVDFCQPMKLREGLALWQQILKKRGKPVDVFVDEDAFKAENPDAPPVLDTDLNIRDVPEQMPAHRLLWLLLRPIPTQNGNYQIRPDRILITTFEQSRPELQVQQGLPDMMIVQRPLDEVLEDLFQKTAVPILVDPRCAHKLRARVSAKLVNGVSLETALRLFTEGVGLRVVLVGGVCYVTTPETVQRLIQEEYLRRLQEGYFRQMIGPPMV